MESAPTGSPALQATDLHRIQSAAIDNAREGIAITDALQPDNPLIFVNKGFVAMTGYSYEEVVGHNCRFLQGPEKSQEAVRRIAVAVRQGAAIQEELINFRKDGSLFWNRLSITPVLNNEGTVTHFIGIQEDITVQKEKARLEEAVARQALITEITLTASERQREEIGRELHDNVNQLLALAMLHTNVGIKDEQRRISMLEKSREVLHLAIAEIRKLSRALVGPDSMETLAVTVAQLVDTLRGSVPFTITLDFAPAIDAGLRQSCKLALYRIVQEQLNNIMKHARPQSVLLQFRRNAAGTELIIRDDGVGFDPAVAAEGIGLQNMRSRAEMEGGSLVLTSAPGSGCELRVVLPH